MSEGKHTPLPWICHAHGGTFYVWGPGQAMVADGETEEGYLVRLRGVGRGATTEEQEANASLIVRAVNTHEELLAALKDCLDEMSHNGDSREVRERACNAIAKAEGRS